jgi:hypothetical protein
MEFVLCGVGFVTALALTTTRPSEPIEMNTDDWTPLWGYTLLFSSFLCLGLVAILWVITAGMRRRRERRAFK